MSPVLTPHPPLINYKVTDKRPSPLFSVYDRAEGTDIKWKEDKDLTKKVEIKKQRNKSGSPRSGGVRYQTAYAPFVANRHQPNSSGQEGHPCRFILYVFLICWHVGMFLGERLNLSLL